MTVKSILDTAQRLLKGEPARVIGYGSAVIVYLVARVSGSIEDIPFEQAVLLTAGYVATVGGVIESIRSQVYSPATVEAILTEVAEDTP